MAFLTVGAVARFAPGPTKGGRLHDGSRQKGMRRALALLLGWSLVPLAGSEEGEPNTPGERRWDLTYFFLLVGLASVGGASLVTRLARMLKSRETKNSWTQTTPSPTRHACHRALVSQPRGTATTSQGATTYGAARPELTDPAWTVWTSPRTFRGHLSPVERAAQARGESRHRKTGEATGSGEKALQVGPIIHMLSLFYPKASSPPRPWRCC